MNLQASISWMSSAWIRILRVPVPPVNIHAPAGISDLIADVHFYISHFQISRDSYYQGHYTYAMKGMTKAFYMDKFPGKSEKKAD